MEKTVNYRTLIKIEKCARCGYDEIKSSLHVHHIMLKMICENAINNIPTDAAVTNGTAAPIEEQPAPRATPSRSRSTNSRGKK